jgi:hypothetical protein
MAVKRAEQPASKTEPLGSLSSTYLHLTFRHCAGLPLPRALFPPPSVTPSRSTRREGGGWRRRTGRLRSTPWSRAMAVERAEQRPEPVRLLGWL